MTRAKLRSNATKHGLSAGSLPPGCGYVARLTGVFQHALEDAVLDWQDKLDLSTMAIVITAVRWERHALLAQRWLRLQADQLTPMEKLQFSRDIARASASRDKCLVQLGLGHGADSKLAVLYQRSAAEGGEDDDDFD